MIVGRFLPIAAVLAVWAHDVAARDLTLAARGEAAKAAYNTAIVEPFAAQTGNDAEILTWDGGIDALRERLKAADNAWDLVELDAEELSVGCAEGLFEKLDWSAVGGRDHYQNVAVADCGVGSRVANTVLAWDKDKLSAMPTWADFWDVKKFPGRRGLRNRPDEILERSHADQVEHAPHVGGVGADVPMAEVGGGFEAGGGRERGVAGHGRAPGGRSGRSLLLWNPVVLVPERLRTQSTTVQS